MKKSRRWNWLLCFLTICMLGILSVTAGAEENILENQVDAAVMESISGQALPKARTVSPYARSRSSDWSYGAQLESRNEQAIYQALANVADMKDYYYEDSKKKKGIRVPLPEYYVCPGAVSDGSFRNSSVYAKARKDYNKATHAYIRDMGEEYWLSYFNVAISGYEATANEVIIKELIFYPVDYYSEIRSELGLTDIELEKAVQAVKQVKGRYNRVKAAHDYVADLVRYNSQNVEAAFNHTITGALLEKYDHLTVCEGYAKLFRLLCTENDIPCILVNGGSSKDASGNIVANHMWNYVKMDDGQWYLVDVTWDDQYGVYDYFLVGSSSKGFGGPSIADDHMAVGCFSAAVAYDAFSVPTLAQKAYPIPVSGLILSETELEIEVEKSTALFVTKYVPSGAENGTEVLYQSSNSAIAEVDANGKITANKPGSVTITVSSKKYPDVKAECKVTVFDHTFDDGVVTRASTCTKKGVKTYTCTNEGCEKEKTEDLPLKAHTPSDWIVTRKATGSVAGLKVRQCTVCKTVLESAAIAKTYVKLNATGTIPLQVKKSTTAIKIQSYTPGDTVEKWTSSNPAIVKVNEKSGKITAGKKTGKAVVTVKMRSGATAKVTIKVQKNKVTTTKLTVSSKTVSLKVDQTYTVKVKRTPTVPTLTEKITFSSSKKSVASVNAAGKITAKKKGKATITVKSGTKKVKITVKVTK